MIAQPAQSLRICPAGGILARALLWLAFGLLAGCAATREGLMDRVQEKQYFRPANFTGEPRLPVDLHRVLLLPVCGGAAMARTATKPPTVPAVVPSMMANKPE